MEKPTKVNPHQKCNFRPRNAAQEETGCPLDHCGFCGGHITDGQPCQAELTNRHHHAWTKNCLDELFEKWWTENFGAEFHGGMIKETARKAFDFGVEGIHCEFHAYNLGDCGSDDCGICRPEQNEPEPYTGWDAGA